MSPSRISLTVVLNARLQKPNQICGIKAVLKLKANLICLSNRLFKKKKGDKTFKKNTCRNPAAFHADYGPRIERLPVHKQNIAKPVGLNNPKNKSTRILVQSAAS